MAIKTKPTYTEHEVSRILKESEGAAAFTGDRASGHSEGLHELQAVGKKRGHTSLEEIEERIIGPEQKKRSGAFDGCQAKAIAHALNTKAGQAALSYVCMDSVQYVFVKLDIRSGNFRAVNMSTDSFDAPPKGVDFLITPLGQAMPGWLKPETGNAGGIAMKLMKTTAKELHIRTAYPLADAPAPSTAEIRYVGRGGGVIRQELPV